MRIEEKFENTMLNIEMQVVSIANKDSKLNDWQIDKIYSAFISKYKALSNGRDVKKVAFSSSTNELYLLIDGFCDFFTGDSESWGKGYCLLELNAEKISYQDMVAIFKRLRKSVKMWTKRGGSRGYIYYISQFIDLPSKEEKSTHPLIDTIIDRGLAETKFSKPKTGKSIFPFFKK